MELLWRKDNIMSAYAISRRPESRGRALDEGALHNLWLQLVEFSSRAKELVNCLKSGIHHPSAGWCGRKEFLEVIIINQLIIHSGGTF